MEIHYGNPMERERELWIDIQGCVTAIECPEPRRVLTGTVEGLATGELLTENFTARHGELWVSWTQLGDDEEDILPELPKVFISYNHDDKELAVSLRDDLKAAGVTTWMDESELLGGDLWFQQIQSALDRCSVMVGAIGPSGIGNFQSLEITASAGRASRGKSRFIPVLLPGASSDSIPSVLDGFHYVDFRIPGKEPLHRLLQAIQGRPPAISGTSLDGERPHGAFRCDPFEGNARQRAPGDQPLRDSDGLPPLKPQGKPQLRERHG